MINTLSYAISFLCLRLNRRRHLHNIYLPFIIFEISGPLSSSSPKIQFHSTSERIFDDENFHKQLSAIFDTKYMRNFVTNSAIIHQMILISNK